MKTSETEIENMLHQAPEPIPPSGLRQRLIDDIRLPKPSTNQYYVIANRQTWLRRWWPSLASAGLACCGLVAMSYVQSQIHDLRLNIQELREQLAQPKTMPAAAESTPNPTWAAQPQAREPNWNNCAETVPELVKQSQILERLSAENQRLRSQPALQPTLDPEDVAAMAEAKEQANRVRCVNNLKQSGWQSGYTPRIIPIAFRQTLVHQQRGVHTQGLYLPLGHASKTGGELGRFHRRQSDL